MRNTLAVFMILALGLTVLGCPQQTEKATVQFDFGDFFSSDKAATQDDDTAKAMSNGDLYDLLYGMKAETTMVQVVAYTQAVWQNGGSPVVNENIDLDQFKRLKNPLNLAAGNYHVYIQGLDQQQGIDGPAWYPTFSRHLDISVNPGNNVIAISLEIMPEYLCHRQVSGLPGNFNNAGEAWVTTKEGQQFNAYWYTESNGSVSVITYLPIWIDMVGIVVTDSDGEDFNFDVCSDPLQQFKAISYVPGAIVATVEVGLTFGFENDVIGNGRLHNSIWEAIEYAYYRGEAADIMLFDGVYEVSDLVIPDGMSVSIAGQGDGTVLRNSDITVSNLISASNFGKGGGSQYITIYNLVIVNLSEIGDYYHNAALFFEAINQVYVENVVFFSGGNKGIATNYCGLVGVNHCVFYGRDANDPSARAVSAYNESYNTMVENSVFLGFRTALHCSNAAMQFQYDLFYGCKLPVSQDVTGVQTYYTPGLIWNQDPLLRAGYQPASTSPCLNAANDGGHIGLYKRPE